MAVGELKVLARKLRSAGPLALSLLAACTTVDKKAVPIRDEAFVHIKLVDEIPPPRPGYTSYGQTTCTANGVCEILLIKGRYPYCLKHEARHVMEGNWHEGRETLDDCR